MLLLLLSSSALACDPNNVLCSRLINPVISQISGLNQFFVWFILGLMSLSISFLAYAFFMDVFNAAHSIYEKYKPFEVGEYVRLPDGSFVSSQEYYLGYSGKDYNFVNKWLDSETTTMVSFNNAQFDWEQRNLLNDPAIDYLGKEQPEIIGYNDECFDDVWDRRAPIGNPEVYVSLNESEVEDEPFIRHISGIEGFIDSLLSGEKVEEEDFPYENFDDWREYDNFWRG